MLKSFDRISSASKIVMHSKTQSYVFLFHPVCISVNSGTVLTCMVSAGTKKLYRGCHSVL